MRTGRFLPLRPRNSGLTPYPHLLYFLDWFSRHFTDGGSTVLTRSRRNPSRRPLLTALAAIAALSLLLAACGSSSKSSASGNGSGDGAAAPSVTLRLGY